MNSGKTDELRDAHDVLAEFYADRLANTHDEMPVDRAVLGLFCELVLGSGLGTAVGDIGSGSGRLAPTSQATGSPRAASTSPRRWSVSRDGTIPRSPFDVADLRDLPFEDSSLAGAVCWYSLMYLAPADRPRAFGELARVVRPGGHLVTAFKAGDGTLLRAGRTTGLDVEFDIYWFAPAEVERMLTEAGFHVVFTAGRPAVPEEQQPQGYVIAQRS